jgi:hypothetical protein
MQVIYGSQRRTRRVFVLKIANWENEGAMSNSPVCSGVDKKPTLELLPIYDTKTSDIDLQASDDPALTGGRHEPS